MESVQTKGDRILPERQVNHNENIEFQAGYCILNTLLLESFWALKLHYKYRFIYWFI